ncbi:MAG: S10 family peptidase [Flavobacteriaceae bacterium]
MKNLLSLFILFNCGMMLAQERSLPVDMMKHSEHQQVINGKKVSFQTTIGTQPVWNNENQVVASLFYTYYKRTDISTAENRPLLISFNGGPGSASVWMHIAYTGPKVLKIDDEGYPVQPYGVEDNPYSILDVADILYINPVNTGYSRMVQVDGKWPDKKQFFGVNADVNYLSEWINTFVTRHNRWPSPKYIIGESYGGTRVSGLAGALQESQWMYLNGVILVSPADYKSYGSDDALSSALNLPYFAAASWYHGTLSTELQDKDLLELLPEVEQYAINNLMPALAKGGFLSQSEKESIAEKMAYYTGLDQKEILQFNLDIPTSYFWKDLLRDQGGYTVGRLDSRYKGIDKTEAGVRTDFNPELNSWLHSFTPAINYYFKSYLDLDTDVKYNVFGPVRPWDFENNETREQLRKAMAMNPYLNVLYQTGYYDGATTYFNSKYSMWQLDPSGKMKDRMSFKGYRSGHMMYLRRDDLKQANQDLRDFIEKTKSPEGSAKY